MLSKALKIFLIQFVIYKILMIFNRDVVTPVVVKGDSPSKFSKSAQTETKTVKNVVNYVPLQTAFEANASLLNKRSWNRIKSHFVAMKSKFLRYLSLIIDQYSVLL